MDPQQNQATGQDAVDSQTGATQPSQDQAVTPQGEGITPTGQTQDQGQEGGSPEPTYEIKVRGKTEKVPVSKLIELAQMGTDYTAKTQELAKRAREEAAELAKQMAPDVARQLIFKAFSEESSEEEPEDPVVAEIRTVRAELETLKREQADRQLKELVGNLKSKYPKMDEERFYARLLVDPSANPEEVAKTLHEANSAYEKQVLEQYLKVKDQGQKAFVETPTGSQIRVPEGKEPANLADAKKSALERLARARTEG